MTEMTEERLAAKMASLREMAAWVRDPQSDDLTEGEWLLPFAEEYIDRLRAELAAVTAERERLRQLITEHVEECPMAVEYPEPQL